MSEKIATRLPLQVRSFQWTGDRAALINAMAKWGVPFNFCNDSDNAIALQAPQGLMYARVGDYIAEGIKGGGWYTMSKEAFELAHTVEDVGATGNAAVPSIATMIKQTTPGLRSPMNTGGCLIMAILAAITPDWSVTQVNAVYDEALKQGIIEANCFINSWSNLINLAANMRGLKPVAHLGRLVLVAGSGNNFGVLDSNDKRVQFIMRRYLTASGAHFRLFTKDGQMYDPDPNVRLKSEAITREDYLGV